MATFTVTTVQDEAFDGTEAVGSPDGTGLSLREAIGLAAALPGADRIVFDTPLLGSTLTLAAGVLALADVAGVTIDGDIDGDGIGDVTISGNSSSGVFSVASGTARLDALTITGGNAAAGAGINVAVGANLTLTSSEVTGNSTTGPGTGGGIFVQGTLNAVGSTIANNSSLTGGGASVAATGDATFVNTTFHNNTGGQNGGAISNAGTLALSSSTVTGNSTSGSGGGVFDSSSQLTITNTILAGNNAVGGMGTEDIAGTIDTASGVNIFGQSTVLGAGTNDIASAVVTDVFAGAATINGVIGGVLADNGGPVDTVLIKRGGTADAAGDATALTTDTADLDGDTDTSEPLPLDARGTPRVGGSGLDVGAVEALTGPFIVTTLNDELDNVLGNNTVSIANFGGINDISLREAIALAANTAGADVIQFAAPLAGGTVLLTNGEVVLNDTGGVTISGDITVDAQRDSRVFNVIGGVATLDGLTITNGDLDDGDGGGARVSGGAVLNISNALISSNSGYDDGGGVYVQFGGALNVTNSTFILNSAKSGGGIHSRGTVNVISTTFDSNSASRVGGGGAFNSGDATFINTTFFNNTSLSNFGGAVANFGNIVLSSSTLTGNIADLGGGITNYGTLTTENSIVVGNRSGSSGGSADLRGSISTTNGNNIFGQASVTGAGINDITGAAASSVFDQTATVNGVTAGVLGDNGGPVRTVLISSAGPAFDRVQTADLASDTFDVDGDQNTAEPLPLDARGLPRTSGATSDVGAVELQLVGTLTVTTLDDEAFNGGPLATELADGNGLSLREAIGLANAGLTDANSLINFQTGLNGTVTLTQGTELLITNGITIDGNGTANTVIDGNLTSRVFNVTTTDAVTLQELTVQNGRAANGGGIYVNANTFDLTLDTVSVTGNASTASGGGVWATAATSGSLAIIDSTIDSNTATNRGGGVAVVGDLTLADSTVSNNSVVRGTSPDVEGGGVSVTGSATITGSAITDNSLQNIIGGLYSLARTKGGGVAVNGGVSVIENSTIAKNAVRVSAYYGYAQGGGIFSDASPLTVIGSTIEGNSVDSIYGYSNVRNPVGGGGIFSDYGGSLIVVSSTVSGNTTNGSGGGILQTDSQLTVVNATIQGNTAITTGSGIYQISGTGRIDNSTITANTGAPNAAGYFGAATISNSILVGNAGFDIAGTGWTSGGNNVIGTYVQSTTQLSDVTGATAAQTFAATGTYGSTTGGALTDNGGPVRTVMISSAGPAVDRVQTADLAADTFDLDSDTDTAEPLPLDARGLARTTGAAADVGAVELQSLALVVTTLADEPYDPTADNTSDGTGLSLREALEIANRNPGADTITFASGLSGTLRLTQGELVITDAVTIDGGGLITITGDADDDDVTDATDITNVAASGTDLLDDNSRVFNVTDASAATTLSGLTITGGRTTGFVETGGGVRSLADLTLVDSLVTGNSTAGTGGFGGGIFGGGTVAVANSTVSGNSTSGISGRGGGVAANGDVALTNSTISGNSTASDTSGGGGIYAIVSVTLTNSTVSGNSTGGAGSVGGGIFNPGFGSGGITLTNSIVLGNTTTGSGVGGDELFLNTSFGDTVSYTGGNIVGTNIFSGSGDVGDTTAAQVFAATVNNNGVDAGALANNGGAVPTIALRAGGDAVGRGDATLLPADTLDLDNDGDRSETLPVDATGGPRIDGTLDLGAVEAREAPSLIVTTLTDVVDGADGQTFLREAILFANSQAGADTITFAAGLSGTLRLTQGELGITDAVTINGGGRITITGDAANDDVTDANDITDVAASGADLLDDNSRVFNITASTTLSGLTITGGRTAVRGEDTIGAGGGIRSDANLALINSTISGNSTAGSSGGGGGIFGGAAVTLTSSTVSGNTVESGSSRGGGGGIFNYAGVTLTNSTISGNSSAVSGGGISSYTTVTLANSTVSGNSTENGSGGGIYAFDNVALTNSTVSGNSSVGVNATGGGIYATYAVTLTNSTVSGNSTAGPRAEGGGIYSGGVEGSGITLTNSIVLGNTTTGAGVGGDELFVNTVDGASVSYAGGNIVGSNILSGSGDVGDTTAAQVFAATVNNNGVLAGALGDNGGSVPTIAILAGGDAVGRGDVTLLPADGFDLDNDGDIAEALPIDATGAPRVIDTLDLGAVEADEDPSLIVTTLTDVVDSRDGQTSLREAIEFANSQAGADTITFAAGLSGTLRLTQGELVITDAVTINGGGRITITGDAADDDVTDANDITDVAASGADLLDDNSRVFNITSAAAATTLSGLTITGGRTTELTEVGAGIYASASVTLINSAVSGNSTAGDFSGGGGITSFGAVVLTNSTLSGNSTTGTYASGGGILGYGAVTLTNSTVSGNSTAGTGSVGGGISGSVITLTNTIVLGNTTTGAGVGGDELVGSGGSATYTGGNIVGTNIFNGSADVGDTTAAQVFAATVNNNGVDAGALANNGGGVPTIALLAGGDAVGRGDATLLPADTLDLDNDNNTAEALPLDATGGPRIDGTLDLGAVEAREAPSLTVTTLTDVVDRGDGQTSLREALGFANNQAGADTITFAAGLSGTLRLTQGELGITDDVTINGGGLITITGDAADDDVTDANDITDVAASGADLLDDNSRIFNIPDTDNITLVGLTITGGRSIFGGAITSQGSVNLVNSLVSGNSTNADFGVGGGIFAINSVTLTNSTVSGNSTAGANSDGGGIFSLYNVSLVNSTVSGNATMEADSDGGGVLATYGLSVVNSTVSGNAAMGIGSEGGGLFSAGRGGNGITLTNSIVLGNTTTGVGVGGDELFLNSVYGGSTSYTGGNIVGTNIFSGSVDVGDTTAAQVFAATVNNNGVDAGALALVGGSVPVIPLSGVVGNPAVGSGDATLLPTEQQLGIDVDGDGDGNIEPTAIEVDATTGLRIEDSALDLGAVEERILIIDGTSAPDTLAGTNARESITGRDGADELSGGGAADQIKGDRGNDTLMGDQGQDTLDGGRDDDSLDGGDDADRILGRGGRDELLGGNGPDTLRGGSWADLINGGEGDDRLYGGAASDTLIGGAGSDLFFFIGDFFFDRIEDFEDMAGSGLTFDGLDRVNLRDFRDENGGEALTFDQLLITQVGSRTRIEFDIDRDGVADVIDLDEDGDTDRSRIDLMNFTASNLGSEDFIF